MEPTWIKMEWLIVIAACQSLIHFSGNTVWLQMCVCHQHYLNKICSPKNAFKLLWDFTLIGQLSERRRGFWLLKANSSRFRGHNDQHKQCSVDNFLSTKCMERWWEEARQLESSWVQMKHQRDSVWDTGLWKQIKKKKKNCHFSARCCFHLFCTSLQTSMEMRC